MADPKSLKDCLKELVDRMEQKQPGGGNGQSDQASKDKR